MDSVAMGTPVHQKSGLPDIDSMTSNRRVDMFSSSISNNNRQQMASMSRQATGGGANSEMDHFLPQMSAGEPVNLGRIRLEHRPQKSSLPPSVRHTVTGVPKSRSVRSQLPPNTAMSEPMPYQPQYFKSTTLLKMVPVPKRHQEMFADKQENLVPREKPLIIHSERYQFNDPLRPAFERMSQRDRLHAEQDYMMRLKLQKRSRETLPHRETKDLLMGGRKALFSERFDIQDELRRLKSIVLPVNARELYHGKGIELPPTHSSIRPRYKMPPPLPSTSPESEESAVKEAALYRGHSKSTLDGMQSKRSKKPKEIRSKIDSHNNLIARTHQSDTASIGDKRLQSNTRRSADTNMAIAVPVLQETASEGQPPATPLEEDYVRRASVSQGGETVRVGAESEMDIYLPSDTEQVQSPKKPITPVRKAPTPNPLKAADLSHYKYSESELRNTFNKLDTDSDGHLMYQQVEPEFPKNLRPSQKKYLKQIYDITSASTFFGVKEFVTMKCLCDEVESLNHQTILNGFDKIDFSTLTTTVIQYAELFQQVDRSSKGKIALSSLEDILCTALRRDKAVIEFGLSQIRDVLKLDSNDVSKIKFVAGIPFFLMIKSLAPPVDEAVEETVDV